MVRAEGRRWLVVVWAGTALYAVGLTVESVYRHHGFQTSFDLAIYDQYLWLLSHAHAPFSSLLDRTLLGDHFSPGVMLLTPLYWLGLGVPGLLALQSVALALTAPVLYALARHTGAGPKLAAIPAVLWLVSPWTTTANLFEFHPTTLVPVLLTLSVLAAVRDQWWLLAASAALAMSMREDIPLAYVMLGIVLALHGRRRLGATLAGAAVVWGIAATKFIESKGDSLRFFGERFAGNRGHTVGGAAIWMLEHPLSTISFAVGNSGSDALLLLFATGALALLAPSWILLGAPALLHNALTANVFQHDLLHDDHIVVATSLFVAAAFGVRRLPELALHRVVGGVAVGVAAALAFVVGLSQHDVWNQGQFLQRDAVRRGLALIPPDASVAATIHLDPHLSHRRQLYALPEPFIPWNWGSPLSTAEVRQKSATLRYVAYYDGDGPLPYVRRALPLLRKDGFVQIYSSGPMHVYERRGRSG